MIDHQQKIFFGAPGTGKSHHVNSYLKNIDSNKIFRVTIHPEYTYTDFVGQILPEQSEGNVKFEFKAGIFTRALKEAYSDKSKNVYLILEELSRGNITAILGDIFQLLDRDKHFESKYPIRNADIANQVMELTNDEVILPSNLNIIGTVNTNDQSVFPMDTAFKRRFDWSYVSSYPKVDENNKTLTKVNNPKLNIIDLKGEKITTNWLAFYTSLNQFITDKEKGLGKNEDKQIGQFFITFEENTIVNSHSDDFSLRKEAEHKIENKIMNKLLLYLWQDVEGKSIFNTAISLFNSSINNYDSLYFGYQSEPVFSETFINEFLIPSKDKYQYNN